ncbi:MAG: beta-1,6-N-acetylglucosaminyltransferase [Anaerolineales bacterium]
MKIVYVLLAHTNYEQTMRLYKHLDQEGTSIVLHISKTCETGFYERMYATLKDRPNSYFTERAYVRWGDFGMVQGVLNAIDTICEKQIDFDYAMLISGQDYPLKPHNIICQTLEKHRGYQLVENRPYSEIRDDLKDRIESYHFWVGKRHYWYPHENKNKLSTILGDLLLSPFIAKKQIVPHNYIPYKGSFWWNLTKDCIEFLQHHIHTDIGHDLIKFFKHTKHSPESYFTTILMNSEYKDRVVNNDYRYILWPETGVKGRPIILTHQHYDEIASGKNLFGRKFDMTVNTSILDMIDKNLLKLKGPD